MMKNAKPSKSQKPLNMGIPMEISRLDAPRPPKRAPKFLVQGDSNRLRY
jgi:hypothetical protein